MKTEYITMPSPELVDEYVRKAKIAELKRVEAEFLKKCSEDYRFDNEIILNGFVEIVENRIKKLKGET